MSRTRHKKYSICEADVTQEKDEPSCLHEMVHPFLVYSHSHPPN